MAVLVYGLVAFIPSHALVFTTAHQVYGDPFVLLVLGAFFGFADERAPRRRAGSPPAPRGRQQQSPVRPGLSELAQVV